MVRLGLCCIFANEPIKFRTTTAKYLKKVDRPYEYLSKIIAHNLDSLLKALEYCKKASIGSFRLSSQFFPLCSHPDWKYDFSYLPELKVLKEKVQQCRGFAEINSIRLVLHPDQFVVLNSPREEVVRSAVSELRYQAGLADLLGIDVINIHAGGVYGNKEEALQRFEENYLALPPDVKARLTVENDDKSYTPKDLLPLCRKLKIPLVYDVHHHRCHGDGLTIEETTELALATWDREPLFHVSSPIDGWEGPNIRSHHDYINPEDFPTKWNEMDQLTVEIEAKAKELAIAQLQKDLFIHNPGGA